MSVETVRVVYKRSKQPKDFESISPEVEFTASIQDEDHRVVAAQLMVDAAAIVHAGMGLSLPAMIAKKLGVEPDKTTAKPKKSTATKPKEDTKEEEPNIRANPEDRVNPDDDIPGEEENNNDEIPGEETSNEDTNIKVPEGLDHQGLHSFMASLVTGKGVKDGKKVPGDVVKTIFNEYDNVTRVSDLPKDKISEVYRKLYALKLEAEKE